MTVYTWVLGTGFWSTSTKWSPGGVPTSADSAVIAASGSAYSVSINAAAFAYSLSESSANATVNDASSLTIGAGGFALSAGAFNLNAGGTLATTTTTVTGGAFNWNGGTISGGAIDIAALNLSADGATGYLANGARVKNAAGTGNGTINDTGYQSYLYFENTQTFVSATINIGNTTGFYSYLYEQDTIGSGAVLTLASSVTVNVAGYTQITGDTYAGDGIVNQGTINQTAGYLSIAGNAFTNSGAINDTGASDALYILSTNFSNTGVIKVSGSGSALHITPGGTTWSNTGAIEVSGGATLYLGGAFSASDLASVTDSGGAIYLQGTLNNTGAIVDGSGGLGEMLLQGGEINGGTVTTAGLGLGYGTLYDVDYEGILNVSTNFSSVHLGEGSQVVGAGGAGTGAIEVTGYGSSLVFDNTQTFANATIHLGSTTGYESFLDAFDVEGTGAVLTLASSITVDVAGSGYIADSGDADDGIVNQGTINIASGVLTIAGNDFTNSGAIDIDAADETLQVETTTTFSNGGVINVGASGAALYLTSSGSWSNSGSIAVSNGGALHLGGVFTLAELGSTTDSGGTIYIEGTLDNAGSVLDGSGGLGQLSLRGGAVDGGTVKPAGIAFTAYGGTLDDVMFDGTLDLSASGASVGLANGARVNNAAGMGPGIINDTGDESHLAFDNTQTFAGATINLAGVSYLTENDIGEIGATLTLASTVTINTTGVAEITSSLAQVSGGGYVDDNVVNQGTIRQTGGNLEIDSTYFTNSGTIDDSGDDDAFSIQSVASSTNAGSIVFDGSDESAAFVGGGFTNTGVISVGGVGDTLSIAPDTFTNLSGGALTGGTYSASAGAVIELNNNTTITTDNADIILSGAGSVIQDLNTNTSKQNSFDLTLRTIGAAGQLHILGGRNFITAAAAIADNGVLELGGGSLVVSGTGSSFTIGSTGKLMGFGTASATSSFASSGLIEASGGTLTAQEAVTGTGGYQIDSGATLVLDGAVASGQAATFNGPSGTLTLAAPASFAGAIGGLGFVDHIDLMGITANAAAVNGSNQLVVSNNGATVATLQLSGSNGGFSFLTQAISGGTAIIALPVPPTVAEYLSQSALYDLIPGGFAISDTAANIAANIGSLLDAHIHSITATGGVVTVSAAVAGADPSALDKISGGYAVADTAADISAHLDQLDDAAITSITITDNAAIAVDVAQLTSDATAIGKLADAGGGSVELAVTDSAADIEAGLTTLESDVNEIAAITVSSGTVAVSTTSFAADQAALDRIVGGFEISDSAADISAALNQLTDANIQSIVISDNAAVGVNVGQLASDATEVAKLANANSSAYQLAVADSAANISGALDLLQSDVAHIASIKISDNAAIGASVAQVTSDAGALAKLADANATPYQLAIADTAANVQAGLSTLAADNAHIGSITASGGYVAVSTALFGADQPTLDKIVGGFEVSDSAPNIVAALTALNADAHVVEIAATSGTATLSSGSISVANLVETGSATTLTIGENLTYAGGLSQGAGATLSVSTSDVLTLKGGATLAGTVGGFGALALTGGAATIASGAKLSVAKLSISGATTTAALNESLIYAGTFSDGAGATLSVASGDILTLTGTATLGGAITGLGALTVSGGTTTLSNTAALTTARWTVTGAATTAAIAGGLVTYGGVFTLNTGATAAITAKDALKLTGTSNISGIISGAGTLDIGGGAATFFSGAQVTAAAWSLISAGATTIQGNLSYGGAFSQAAVPTLGITSGSTFTLTGNSTLDGLVKGAGTLALTGGTATIAGGAVLNVASWSVAGTAVTIAKNLAYVGPFTAKGGAALTLSGTNAALTLQGHSVFDGATVNGAGVLFTAGPAGVGSTAVDGLTIGGSVAWTNARTITENGGGLTLGDASNGAVKLTNAKAGIFDITDNNGVALVGTAASIANVGVFEKTAGNGDSLIAPGIANTGLIEATSGELELQGAISSGGLLQVGGGAKLQLDGTVAATQTLSYATGSGTISLDDLDAAGVQLFHGTIHGWAGSDLLDVGAAFGSTTQYSFVENKGHTGGVLNLSGNNATAAINFSGLTGIVSTANFTATVNGVGDTVFAYHT